MEAIAVTPETGIDWSLMLPEGVTILQDIYLENQQTSGGSAPAPLGPVFFSGRSPFRIRVMILTCFAIPEDSVDQKGYYITYVGYKKETDREFDFDEMIPSASPEDALKTHSKACGFFGNSSLFVKSV